ncbi:hypothetical protein PC118_g23113, partial [Phytophthora cactorum]
SFAALKRHRDSRHRRTAFLDKFSAGCACGTPFDSRLAAARHAPACASLSSTASATTSSPAGASSHTDDGVEATVTAAAQAEPDLPHQDTELTASPPLASSSDVDVQDLQDQSRWGPPLSRALVTTRIADRLGELPPPRWGPPLPRTIVASRIAARLDAIPAPRWDPPLPRDLVASRIAARLAPPTEPPLQPDSVMVEMPTEPALPQPMEVTVDEETKESEPPSAAAPAPSRPVTDSTVVTAANAEWLLKFDGACRRAPNHGGAGAALFSPDGSAAWTCSCYMPNASETNNTAEYTALLLGARAATDHGATQLRVQGDSLLVIRQVKGIYATKSTRLRTLRNAVRAELAKVSRWSLHHIDRQDNGHADRLANRALDMKNTLVECAAHPGRDSCTTSTALQPATAPPASPPPADTVDTVDMGMDAASDDERRADVDDGEVYAPMTIGPDEVPARRPRLRLRQLSDEELEAAGDVVERLGAALSAKITDAEDWATAEGYITALPHLLYDKLQPYSRTQPQSQQPSRPLRRQRQPAAAHHEQQRAAITGAPPPTSREA